MITEFDPITKLAVFSGAYLEKKRHGVGVEFDATTGSIVRHALWEHGKVLLLSAEYNPFT
jgi:hypothetical protein